MYRKIELTNTICHVRVRMRRVGWTTQQGREHLIKNYGKHEYSQLNDEQLLEFLNHLKSIEETNGK